MNDKDFQKFKDEFDEIILTVDSRLEVLEKKLESLNKLMQEFQTGVRQIDRKTDVEWNGLRGSIGDLQKKLSEIAKPIKDMNRNRGYSK